MLTDGNYVCGLRHLRCLSSNFCNTPEDASVKRIRLGPEISAFPPGPIYSVQKKKRIFLFLLLNFACQSYGKMLPTRQCQTPCSTQHHTVPRQQQRSKSSPALPCQHTGNERERRVRGRVNAPANVRELFQALKQGRVASPAQVLYNLIQSMPQRCWAVTDSRRGHTPYWCACHSIAKYRVIQLFFWVEKSVISNWLSVAKWVVMNLIVSWIFEQQFNSKANQTCISFLLLLLLFEQYSTPSCGWLGLKHN